MRLSQVLWISVIALGPMALSAQAPDGELFSKLQGRWDGAGELFGRTAFFEMSWRIPFDGVATLHFTNGFVAEDGTRTTVIQAAALYRFAGDGSDGVWMDSRGERVTLDWELDGTTLRTRWRSDSEEGRTEYSIVSAEEVHVIDEVLGAEGWHRFATAEYRRRRNP